MPLMYMESLAVNLRGFTQNAANGNNNIVINSELRLPCFPLLNRPVNNTFLRNFQIVQFLDLGTAWNGKFNKLGRPNVTYSEPGNPLSVEIKAPGIGPSLVVMVLVPAVHCLVILYGFDASWPMNGFFKGKPKLYVSLGFDFLKSTYKWKAELLLRLFIHSANSSLWSTATSKLFSQIIPWWKYSSSNAAIQPPSGKEFETWIHSTYCFHPRTARRHHR